MPKLRITVPALIEGGNFVERQIWLAHSTDDENEAVLLMSALPDPRLDLPQAPSVLCWGNAGALSSCMKILAEEFPKEDPVTSQLLGLPLVEMENRRSFIGRYSVVAYLRALHQFSQMNKTARSNLWNALIARAAPHAIGGIILDPVKTITPHKIPV